jgi:hypothetical protein
MMNYKRLGKKLSRPNGDNIQGFAWGTEENHENLSQDSRFPGRYLEQELPELQLYFYTSLFYDILVIIV